VTTYCRFYVITYDARDPQPGTCVRLLRQREPRHYFPTTDELVTKADAGSLKAAGAAYRRARRIASALNNYARTHKGAVPREWYALAAQYVKGGSDVRE
jgi:hypothetical protein